MTLELVTTGLEVTDPFEEVESLLAAGRFLYASRGLVVLTESSMARVFAGRGPAFVCLLLNWEKREWGSIALEIVDGLVVYTQ